MIRIDGWFCASSEPSSETAAYRGVLHSETGSEPRSEPGSETAARLQRRRRAYHSKQATRSGCYRFYLFLPAGKFFTLTSEACRALGFLCLGFARVLRALPAHMLCALHTTLVLVTMRLGCDASTLAKRPTSCVAHMHAHVQGCLDIGLCAACQHRCRATGSRMHARGLFT